MMDIILVAVLLLIALLLHWIKTGPTPETDRPIPQDCNRTQNIGFGEAQPVPEGAPEWPSTPVRRRHASGQSTCKKVVENESPGSSGKTHRQDRDFTDSKKCRTGHGEDGNHKSSTVTVCTPALFPEQRNQSEDRIDESDVGKIPAVPDKVTGHMATHNVVTNSTHVTIVGEAHASGDINISTHERQDDFGQEIYFHTQNAVPTPVLDHTLELLKKHSTAILTGCPGSGKTVMAYMVLKAMMKDYCPCVMKSASDFKTSIYGKENVVIFIDDLFGSVTFEQSLLTDLRPFLKNVQQLIRTEKVKVIFTTRISVLEEAIPFLDRSQSLFNHKLRVNLSAKGFLPDDIMMAMLNSHLRRSDKLHFEKSRMKSMIDSFDKDTAVHGFPHCCEFLLTSKHAQNNPEYFFAHPLQVMKSTVTSLLKENNKVEKLFKFLIFSDCIDLRKLECDKLQLERADAREVIAAMTGTFLRSEGHLVKFKHPSLYECTAAVIGKNDPEFILKSAKIAYICRYVQISDPKTAAAAAADDDDDDDDDSIMLTLKNYMTEELVERFASELTHRSFTVLFTHPLWRNLEFSIRVISAAVSKDGKDCIISWDGSSRSSMLHWAARIHSKGIFEYVFNGYEHDISNEVKVDTIYGCLIWSNIEGLEYLLKKYPDCTVSGNFDGASALSLVARRGSDKMVRLLMEKGIDINDRDDREATALHWAAAAGNTEVLDTLIQAGCDINAENGDSATPLHFAVLHGHRECVESLVAKECSLDVDIPMFTDGMNSQELEFYACHEYRIPGFSGTPLHIACLNQDPDLTKILLAAGADTNAVNGFGLTPLHATFHHGNSKCLSMLLNKGANVNIRTDAGSIFDKAVFWGKIDHFLKLLSCLPNSQRWVTPLTNVSESLIIDNIHLHHNIVDGYTILHLAALSQNVKLMQSLLNYSTVNVHVRSVSEFTPFLAAVATGNVDMMDILIAAGSDVNHQTFTGKMSALYLASSKNDIATVKYLLNHGANVDLKGMDDSTALHLAILVDHQNMVKLLIQNGARIDTKDPLGITPMHLACRAGNTEILNMLLENKADINVPNALGEQPLSIAAYYDSREVVNVLISAGVEIDHLDKEKYANALFLAADSGYFEIATSLLKAGANPNIRCVYDQTPLTKAAESGHERLVKALIQNNGDVNHKAKDGMTPLMLSILNGHTSVARHLLKHEQINLQLEDIDGDTALHFACRRNMIEVVRMLTEVGVDVNTINNQGETPLIAAVQGLIQAGADVSVTKSGGQQVFTAAVSSGRTIVLDKLIQAGADLNMKGKHGKTALLAAAKEGSCELVGALLGASADVNITNIFGVTPLYEAARRGHLDIVKMLVDAGADIHVIFFMEKTPLTVAAQYGRLDVVQYLLGKGADVNGVDAEERTALSRAVYEGHIDVVMELIGSGISPECLEGAINSCRSGDMMDILLSQLT
ncbi:ankyrin-1-like [Haliotis rufescens]|uniref:ankyrin-1-like n=1 Tax=Haliotis rufescens TaxID=6454 RepID=UPI00201EF64B|nr:ankyrin-1-like [Haliotis rufescens]